MSTAPALASMGIAPGVLPPLAAAQARATPGLSTRQTAEVACPRSMVGRVIGKNGETIKALQLYTGCLIQIDQSTDPTRVTISGTPQSLSLAVNMVTDICKGTFKGFALLRQLIQPQRAPGGATLGTPLPRPVYAPGYGLIPPSQLFGSDDPHLLQTGAMQLIGAQPGTALLGTAQPAGGFQYVQTAQLADGQIVLGMPGAMPGHTLGASQDGTTLLSAMPVQQLQPLQQVYNTIALPGGGFATQLTYHPASPHDLSGAGMGAHGAEQLLYATGHGGGGGGAFSMTQAQLASSGYGGAMHGAGSAAGKMLVGGGGPSATTKPDGGGFGAPGRIHQSGGSGTWIDAATSAAAGLDGATGKIGSVVVEELLGGSGHGQGGGGGGGGGGLQGLGGQAGPQGGGGGHQHQHLVQVISPEGQISYYLQQGGES